MKNDYELNIYDVICKQNEETKVSSMDTCMTARDGLVQNEMEKCNENENRMKKQRLVQCTRA